jgi:hypothetical protein
MGGNLFRFPRMPRDRYLEVDAFVRSVLTRSLGPEGASWRVPRWLGDKADFGDMDVLVDPLLLGDRWPGLRRDLARELMGLDPLGTGLRIESLRPGAGTAYRLGVPHDPAVIQFPGPRAVGNVFTVPVRGLQVDLFTVDRGTLDPAWSFMCFNDCGNLLGRLARRLDAKLGDRGLAWVFRGDDHASPRELELTCDWDRILWFLGLPSGPWRSGFGTKEEMFAWATGSPFFDPSPYLPGARAADVIRRSGGRSTVAAFCGWVQARVGSFPPPAPVPARGTPESLTRLGSFFPLAGVQAHRDRWQAEHDRDRALGRALSGARVMELTGLRGRALGAFLARCRERLVPGGRGSVESFLLSAPPDRVDAAVLALHTGPCPAGAENGTIGA